MNRKILFAIVLIGLILRLFWLDKYPAGFNPDEASFGYDAYSILKTGNDQWGNSFPLVLKSFGDYKAPLYTYLAVPSVGLFGLGKFAVRLPNAILSVASIYITFLLALELGTRIGYSRKKSEIFGLISSLLLSVSSWHIMMSRGAFEAAMTTFFLPLGIYLFLKGLGTKKGLYFSFSSLAFGLNLFSYHSAKLVTPLVVLFLILIYLKDLSKQGFKKLLPPLIIFSLFSLVTLFTLVNGAGTRASQISIFKGALEDAAQKRLTASEAGLPPQIATIFHNKYQVIAQRFTSNYVQYFSPLYLFTNGPSETTYGMIPGRGVLYWFEIAFLLAFFSLLFTKGIKNISIILVWLLIAPIPASLSVGFGYAANRSVIALPALQIILALGALTLFDYLETKFGKKVVAALTTFLTVISLLFVISFLEDYFIQSPVISEKGMSSGNLEAAEWLASNMSGKKIVVSTTLSEPHIYIAFANKWDPADYQTAVRNWNLAENNVNWIDQLPSYNLGNYTFKRIDWPAQRTKDEILVGRPEEFPEGITPIKTIFYPDGKPGVFIVNPKVTNVY